MNKRLGTDNVFQEGKEPREDAVSTPNIGSTSQLAHGIRDFSPFHFRNVVNPEVIHHVFCESLLISENHEI